MRRTVYYGTSAQRWMTISGLGFRILPIYVTERRSIAEHYAQARAARDKDTEYVVVRFDLPETWLAPDNYSALEPGQWKLERTIPIQTLYSQNCRMEQYAMPIDEAILLRLQCFAIGMGQGEGRREVKVRR